MIHEEICTYEVCKLAKEKGFPQYENGATYIYGGKGGFTVDDNLKYREVEGELFEIEYWNPQLNDIAAPTQSLLQRWLRDNGFGEVEVRHWCETNRYPHHYGWEVKDNLGNLMGYSSKMFDTYELALEDALAYSLKNLV